MDTTNLPLIAPVESQGLSGLPGPALPVEDGAFPAEGPKTPAPAGDMFSLVLLQRLLGLAKRGEAEQPAAQATPLLDVAVTLTEQGGKELPSGAELPETGVDPGFLATLRGTAAPLQSASATTLKPDSSQTPVPVATGLPVTPASPSAAIPSEADVSIPLAELLVGEGRAARPVLPAGPAQMEAPLPTQPEASALASARPADTAAQPAPSQPQGMPSATSQLSTSLGPPVGGKGWDHAFGQRVVWVVNQQVQAAEIKLNPPNLGAVEVRVNVDGDDVQVSFTAQQGLAREALEAAIPRLREMFAEQGLNLANVDVSPRDSGERHGREMAAADGHSGGDAGADDAQADSDQDRGQVTGQGLVDYFV